MAMAIPMVMIGMQLMQGMKAKEAAGQQADLMDQEAGNIEQAGAYEVGQMRKQHQDTTATQAAQYGKAGVEMVGSPMNVIGNTAKEQELDVLTKKYNTQREASGMRANAELKRKEGQNAMFGAGAQAGGTLLGNQASPGYAGSWFGGAKPTTGKKG